MSGSDQATAKERISISCLFFNFINNLTRQSQLLQLLLDAQLVGVSALLLAAVGGARREASIALAADFLVAVVLTGKHSKRRLNHTTTEAEDEVEGALLLDVVVRESAAILQLLSSENLREREREKTI
jgi:hypothetical protein